MPEPSGPEWCARFPGSKSTDDLLAGFRDRVLAFISAMERGGATVSIAATYRPPERAYLMHWCCMIAGYVDRKTGQHVIVPPSAATPMEGVDIDWTHGGDVDAARAAASLMVAGYAIQFPAALKSNHTLRRAIDMAVSWSGNITVVDFDGQSRAVTMPPRSGSNQVLVDVGRSFGVIKLLTDPPHWSDDGH